MHGGVVLFRGTGAAARRYLEADRSRADEYYLDAGASPAELAVVDHSGSVVEEVSLSPVAYAGWVDWVDPVTGSRWVGPATPGTGGGARRGSRRWW